MRLNEILLNGLLSQSADDSAVHFMQQRVVIFDALAQGILRKELIDNLGYEKARKVLTRFGYAQGWQTARMLQRDFPEVLKDQLSGEHLHRVLGHVNTVALETVEDTSEHLCVRSKMKNSYEAEQHLSLVGKSDEGVCWTLTGYASGYESLRRGRDVFFLETHCTAKGDLFCAMEGRYKDDWGDELNEHLPYFEVDDIGETLLEQQASSPLSALIPNEHGSFHQDYINPVPGFVARSDKMANLFRIATRAAQVNSTILVSGDTGVGKEHISRYIHQASPRRGKAFISVNCAAINETLLEAELFGHTKGAFTGAEKARAGLFEEANGGTIFLDEIGESSLAMQAKLLRVIQEKEVTRIGENHARALDVRVIVATNRDLKQLVERGEFRKDLYYRLRVIELQVPPLVERREDILPIANLLLHRFSVNMNRNVLGLSRGAIKCLLDYDWPGNVRELVNTIEYAVALSQDEWVQKEDLPFDIIRNKAAPAVNSHTLPLAQIEKEHILSTLNHYEGDKVATAKSLGIVLSTLYRKLSLYEAEHVS